MESEDVAGGDGLVDGAQLDDGRGAVAAGPQTEPSQGRAGACERHSETSQPTLVLRSD